ncbi:MAG: ATPase [Variovorax sp.]|nr:MAG: ATPase [Variovorax sp.]
MQPVSRGRVIAVVGAPGSGKCSLAQAITARLQAHGIAAIHIGAASDEQSRPAARALHPSECATLAAAQTRRIDAAAAHGVAVADTTELMMMIDCDQRFSDPSLYAGALAAQRGYTVTLLAAVDLNDTTHCGKDASAIDTRIRTLLTGAGVPFTVIYGQGDERLINAWNALQGLTTDAGMEAATRSFSAERPERADQVWTWSCDTCSDPVCEHRLFSDLVARRR